MRTLKTWLVTLILAGLPGVALRAEASGCYVCNSGSAAECRDYCAYTGADTFDNRHKCEAKGCRIGGTTACPPPSPAVRICQRPGADPGAGTVASRQCAPTPARS